MVKPPSYDDAHFDAEYLRDPLPILNDCNFPPKDVTITLYQPNANYSTFTVIPASIAHTNNNQELAVSSVQTFTISYAQSLSFLSDVGRSEFGSIRRTWSNDSNSLPLSETLQLNEGDVEDQSYFEEGQGVQLNSMQIDSGISSGENSCDEDGHSVINEYVSNESDSGGNELDERNVSFGNSWGRTSQVFRGGHDTRR